MSTVKYGLSRNGFKRKRLPEILQSLNDRVSDKLGIAIQTGSNSIFGQLHGIYAYEIADMWEQAEQVYNAMYPHTATGSSLSNAAALAGISMIEAERTTLVATCYGTEGASVPYGAQISSSADSTAIFDCQDLDEIITADRCSYAVIKLNGAVVAGTEYVVTIDGIRKSYTAVSGDTATIILTRISSQFSFTDRMLAISNEVLTITMSNERNTSVVTCSNLTISRMGSPFNFRCETYGAVSPNIGDVNQIITTYPGWDGVSNNVAANIGRDAESDTALRQRWSASVNDKAAAMVESISAAIYANVDGVTAVKVYENTKDVTDGDNRPPHSVEVVVAGGEEESIASQIWSHKAAGIDTYGSVSITIHDSQGIPQTMNFNRPEEVPIWMKIVISGTPDETLPAAALQEILAAVLTKGIAQGIGEDVILQRYFNTIFTATTGIGYISLMACSGSVMGGYTEDNISINSRQVAVLDKSRIEVSKK